MGAYVALCAWRVCTVLAVWDGTLGVDFHISVVNALTCQQNFRGLVKGMSPGDARV